MMYSTLCCVHRLSRVCVCVITQCHNDYRLYSSKDLMIVSHPAFVKD